MDTELSAKYKIQAIGSLTVPVLRMHGQLPRNLDEKLVDIEQSYRWLKSGDIKGETESTIVAAQDQQLVQTILRIKF